MAHLQIDSKLNNPLKTKKLLSYCAMNIFSGYMCSKKFQYSEENFRNMVKNFDFIFSDINNGHPTDFLPGLQPFFAPYFNKIKAKTQEIRKYILDNICNEKYEKLRNDPSNINDLVDACFANLLVRPRSVCLFLVYIFCPRNHWGFM